MIHNITGQYRNTLIRPLNDSDLESLRMWRNNSGMNKYLKKINEITPDMQLNWFKNYCLDKSIFTFAIDETNELKHIVGSISIYDIHDTDAKIGKFLIGDENAKGKKIGYYSLLLSLYIGFTKLGLNTIMLDVHENNLPAYHNYEKAGFSVIGKHPFNNDGYELEMLLTKEQFFEIHDFTNEFVINNSN